MKTERERKRDLIDFYGRVASHPVSGLELRRWVRKALARRDVGGAGVDLHQAAYKLG